MEPQKGWATWSPLKKTLVVIGAVIGFFSLAALAAFAYGVYWLYGAGDQADTQIAISSTSVGYVRWVAAEDDPGVSEMLDRFAAALNDVQSHQQQIVPAPLRTVMEFQRAQAKGSLKMFWPRAVTASFEPSEESDRFVAAINMRGMGGFVKGMFMMMTSEMMKDSEMQLRSIEHRDHEILVPTSTTSKLAFSLYGSTILVGEEEDLKGTLDRAIDAAAPEPHARLSNLETMVAPSADLDWVHMSPPQVPTADVGFGLDVVTADRWQSVAIVRAGSPEAAEAAVVATESKIAEVKADLAEEGIQIESYPSRIDPLTARWDLAITNVASALEKSMAEELTKPEAP